MKKGKVITAVIGNGRVTISAYCLTTDSWRDYEYFLAQAEKKGNGESRESNRSLRAALLFLFAHFEGVVHQINLEKNIPKLEKANSLAARTRNIDAFARTKGVAPNMNIQLGKALRDILAHPGIEKALGSEKLTEVTVYETLSSDSLRAMGEVMSNWLDAVCRTLGVIRFTDTRMMVEDLSVNLGASDGVKEI